MKYSFSHKQKHWLNNLVFETAEAAVKLRPTNEQEHIRYQVIQNIKKATKSTNQPTNTHSSTGEERKKKNLKSNYRKTFQ